METSARPESAEQCNMSTVALHEPRKCLLRGYEADGEPHASTVDHVSTSSAVFTVSAAAVTLAFRSRSDDIALRTFALEPGSRIGTSGDLL